MYNTKHWLIGPSEEERIKYFLFCSDKYFLYQQRRRTPVWTKIMKINSFFGTEDFYIPMVVFILW